MYDPKQREKALKAQKELSEGKAAKEALKAMQDQVTEVCRCQDYSPKSELPHDVLRDVITEMQRLQEGSRQMDKVYAEVIRISEEVKTENEQKIDRLEQHIAAQDKLIVAYYVDSKELIDEALKNIGKLKRISNEASATPASA